MSDLNLFLSAVVLFECLLYLRLERKDRETTTAVSLDPDYKKGDLVEIDDGSGRMKTRVVTGSRGYTLTVRAATRWDRFLDFLKHLTALEALPLGAALLILIGFLVKILL